MALRSANIIGITLYAITATAFLIFAGFEVSQHDDSPDYKLVTIEIVHPQVVSVIDWGVLAIAFVVAILSLVSIRRRILPWPMLGLLIAFLLFPGCFLFHVGRNLAQWTTHGEVRRGDGTTFVFCDSSFLQGQTMAIAEVAEVGRFKTSYRVLVQTNGDSPRSWASLIRPVGSSDDYGQLYLTRDEILVGVRYDNRAFLAYDLKHKSAHGHGAIESLSPFVCLDEVSEPSPTDLKSTCKHIEEHAAFCAQTTDPRHAEDLFAGKPARGCPSAESIRAGVQSANPRIAVVAEELQECYDKGIAEVRARVTARAKAQGGM